MLKLACDCNSNLLLEFSKLAKATFDADVLTSFSDK